MTSFRRVAIHPHARTFVWFAALAVVGFGIPVPCDAQLADRAEAATDVREVQDRDAWQELLRQDVRYLASDELRGRSAVGDEIELAAEHVASRFRSLGLNTRLFDGSPFQSVQMRLGVRTGEPANNYARFLLKRVPEAAESNAQADSSDGDREPAPELETGLSDGFMPLAIGLPEATFSGDIVFAGYGISAPDLGYDDYAGIDARGKAVLILRKEPGLDDAASPFEGKKTSRHAFFATKVANAIEHGAKALLIVNDRASLREAVAKVEEKIAAEKRRAARMQTQRDGLPEGADKIRENVAKQLDLIESAVLAMSDELEIARRGVMETTVAGQMPAPSTNIPVISLARDVADRLLLDSTSRSLEATEASIEADYQPASSMMPGVRVELETSLITESASSPNVLASLEGKGPLADETIVVGAHYDHVGMGGIGSLAPGTVAVHNGADDNASGTAVMLAAALRIVNAMKDVTSHRRILFVAFTGEERGLLGSRHYVKFPRFPLEQTVAMINLDMVGRLRDNELTVYGIGSGTGFEELVDAVNEETEFRLFKVATGYGPSDHQSFYQEGIPVLFFFTGLHSDYHRPSDDFDKIDFGGMTRITDMVCGVTHKLAVQAERPEHSSTAKQFEIRRQLTVFLGVTLRDRGSSVELSSVTPGGPAEAAGLRQGDLLERLGRRRINDTSDVLEKLRRHSPGDTLKVQVRRNGRQVVTEVELEPRP